MAIGIKVCVSLCVCGRTLWRRLYSQPVRSWVNRATAALQPHRVWFSRETCSRVACWVLTESCTESTLWANLETKLITHQVALKSKFRNDLNIYFPFAFIDLLTWSQGRWSQWSLAMILAVISGTCVFNKMQFFSSLWLLIVQMLIVDNHRYDVKSVGLQLSLPCILWRSFCVSYRAVVCFYYAICAYCTKWRPLRKCRALSAYLAFWWHFFICVEPFENHKFGLKLQNLQTGSTYRKHKNKHRAP